MPDSWCGKLQLFCALQIIEGLAVIVFDCISYAPCSCSRAHCVLPKRGDILSVIRNVLNQWSQCWQQRLSYFKFFWFSSQVEALSSAYVSVLLKCCMYWWKSLVDRMKRTDLSRESWGTRWVMVFNSDQAQALSSVFHLRHLVSIGEVTLEPLKRSAVYSMIITILFSYNILF